LTLEFLRKAIQQAANLADRVQGEVEHLAEELPNSPIAEQPNEGLLVNARGSRTAGRRRLKRLRWWTRLLASCLILNAASPLEVQAQSSSAAPTASAPAQPFNAEQLDALLAPMRSTESDPQLQPGRQRRAQAAMSRSN